MNKAVFSLLVLLMTTPLFAQDLKFGVRGGPSYTTLGGEGAQMDSKFRIGYHLGGYASFAITESLSFEPGVQFASKGAKPGMNIVSGLFPSVRRYSYIDLPLLFKFQSGNSFYLLAGAQPSFLISSALVSGEGNNKTAFRGIEVSGLWKGFDFAGLVGLGVELGAGMHLHATYEHGFVNISEVLNSAFNRGVKLTFGKSF